MINIRVKNSGVVRLASKGKSPTGILYSAEAERQIPFKIKRVYFITGASPAAIRGNHAHKKLQQVVFCVNGAFTLGLDDGKKKQKIRMRDPSRGVVLGPLLWVTMSGFSGDCVIAIFADDYFRKNDYIRDYDKFRRPAKI